MNIKFILIICFIYLIKLNTSQQLSQTQIDAITELLDEVYGINNTDTTQICTSINWIKCVPMNNGDATNIDYTITEIIFPSTMALKEDIISSFQPFKNLTVLKFTNGLYSENIYTYISTFNYLKELLISKQITNIPVDVELPTSLVKVSIDFISVELVEKFFTSGSISELVITSVDQGFSMPVSFPTNGYLKFLQLPINYRASVFPTNIKNLEVLESLYLTIYNDREIGEYVDFNLPVFDQSPTSILSTVDITFFNSPESTSIQTWTFPNSLASITTLTNLNVYGLGLTGVNTDFSLIKSGLSIRLQDGCEIVDQCTSLPCIKVPTLSSLTFIGCNVNINFIDFTNIISFSMSGNTLEQTLPSTGNSIQFLSVTSFNIAKNNFIGSIPDSYCQFQDSVLSLGYNGLTGLPTCFTCAGSNAPGTKYLLPNSFSDFNSNSAPSTCPTFTFNSYNNTVNTDGSTIITITGKDFGYYLTSYTGIKDIVIIVTKPNLEITLQVPSGIYGKDSAVVATFDNLRSFTFSYTTGDDEEHPSVSSILSYSFYLLCLFLSIQLLI